MYDAERAVTLTLTIEESPYTIRFRPDLTTSVETAEQFCVQTANQTGVTEATFPNCVSSVAAEVTRQVTAIYEARSLTIPITVSGVEFTLKIQPTIEAATEAAIEICVKNSAQVGVTTEAAATECVGSVVNYIRETVTRAVMEAQAKQAAQAEAIASVEGGAMPPAEAPPAVEAEEVPVTATA